MTWLYPLPALPDTFQFRTSFPELPVPPWLRTGNGYAYMFTLEACRDLLCRKAFEAMTIRLPGVGDYSNLPYLAFDRNLQQGPAEPNASFAARLTGAIGAWGESGSAESVLWQLQAYMTDLQPGVDPALPLLTIVSNPTNVVPLQRRVTWTQLYHGDAQGAPVTLTTVKPQNFSWDGNNKATWRRWLILPMALVPVPGLSGSAGKSGAAASSACFTAPGQNVGGVWVPATSGTPVNSPWLTVFGLSGLTAAQVGQWIAISGGAPGNNGTFPIVSVTNSTTCVIANPNGVAHDLGPFTWSIGQYPFIGPGPAWGAPGYVFGQGELVTPPTDTGANIGGVWQPTPSEAGLTAQPSISWGLNCSSLVIVSMRAIVKLWKSAGSYYPHIVVAFDAGDGSSGSAYSPNSDEGSGNPDGSFGSVGEDVNGVWVPTRLITSTWDCYCQGTGVAQNCSVENRS
jgi:hypothetical protein